jgi:spore maturation protein CgeB
MTNYQSELPEYFDIGVDLEAYSSLDELVDKCAYYLLHEEERRQIAQNGYRKVCAMHTYPHRVREMLAAILG